MRTRKYESIYITKSDLADDVQKSISEKMRGVASNHGGQVHVCDIIGKQRLGYEVDGELKGVYHYLGFEGTLDVVKEVERNLRLNESVLKFQTFRVDGDFQSQLVFAERGMRPAGMYRPRGREGGRDFDGDEGGFYEGPGADDMGAPMQGREE